MSMRNRFKKTIQLQDEDVDSDSGPSQTDSPAPETSDPVKLELWNKKHSLQTEVNKLKRKHESSLFATRKFLFPLGVLFGILLAFAFVQPSDIQDMHAQLTLLMDQYDVTLPQLPDFDFSRFETEWNKLRSNIPELWKFNRDGREFQVGERMKARGLSAEYPVVLIPGVISTGLESWSTTPEYRPFFREKLWGGLNMLSQVTFNRDRWIAAMMLDPVTGLDPPDAKIRAAEGIDAASSFIQGYWIWSKIVENLAVVNYDTNNLYLAPYDWRLSYWNLEERDGYFSKLKTTIEGFKLYFLKWVESPEHGGGGPDWVENHIEAYISIAGTHMGVAKAMAAFLSGEMKDTVQMNPAGSYGKSSVRSFDGVGIQYGAIRPLPQMILARILMCSMQTTRIPASVPIPEEGETETRLMDEDNGVGVKNMTSEMAGDWILEHTPSSFQA
ncbi:hypothetical protein HHX47_DHR3000650 [Lentinula edodes]|nr:hypothetical protein HHX47_DHR3000650 [Lentinula edodes]